MTNRSSSPRENRTICLPICKSEYNDIVHKAKPFRAFLDKMILFYPELFPHEISQGYSLKELRPSQKLSLSIRRIEIAGVSYTIRPSFAMPYMTGWVDDVDRALFLRKFGVPYWALAHVFGRNPMYWYRLETQLGRNSIVGTTVKSADKLPVHLAADEKHSWIVGEKCFIATTVGSECILGVSVAGNAGEEALTQSYGIFKQEAQCLKPEYKPESLNADGWPATRKAWSALFSSVVIVCCFLHVFIKIRDRAKKKHRETFLEIASNLWHCYRAENRRSFSQRVRRLVEMAKLKEVPEVILSVLVKLKENLSSYSAAYLLNGAHRTSNMLDRLMQKMDRHLFATRYFHGSLKTAEQNIRGWALIQNFAPSNPLTVKKHGGYVSPAARLNERQYHDNWLQNLLISASLGGFRAPPPNPL